VERVDEKVGKDKVGEGEGEDVEESVWEGAVGEKDKVMGVEELGGKVGVGEKDVVTCGRFRVGNVVC
jgi:hypothetical protein